MKAMGSKPEGLTSAEVQTNQDKYGKNVINEKKENHPWLFSFLILLV